MGHGAADPLVAAVLLNVGDPFLTLTHDLCPLQVEVFVDHLHHNTATTGLYQARHCCAVHQWRRAAPASSNLGVKPIRQRLFVSSLDHNAQPLPQKPLRELWEEC